MTPNPQARTADLTIEPIDQELLIFDATEERAHSLNAAAAQVFRACDGTRDLDAIARHTGLDPDAVALALENLRDCKLLTDTGSEPADTAPRVSRRAAIRKAALTGAALGTAIPVIRSIAAPSAQAATSTCIQLYHHCVAQSCCDYNNQRIGCSAYGQCSFYYANMGGAGHACVTGQSCVVGYHCMNGTCQ